MNTIKLDRPLSEEAVLAQKILTETGTQLEAYYDAHTAMPNDQKADHLRAVAHGMQLAVEQVYHGRRDITVEFLGVHSRPFGFDVAFHIHDRNKKFRFMVTSGQIGFRELPPA